MYNIDKRIWFSNTTVERLIEELSRLPKDMQVLCGGTVDMWLHVDDENNIVNIDYDDLEVYYGGSDEKEVAKDEEVILLYDSYGHKEPDPYNILTEVRLDYDSREEADYMFNRLEKLIRENGCITVKEMFENYSRWKTDDPKAAEYGWVNLSDASIYVDHMHWDHVVLMLPKPISLSAERDKAVNKAVRQICNAPENAEIVAYSYFDDSGMPIKTIDLSMEISADFDKTMDAAYTLEHLKLRIRAYGFVNVTDLFNICALGIIKDPRGNFYGWTDLSDARYYTDVANNRTTLKLPKPKFLGEGAKA